MQVDIITIGDELLIGQVVDTNSAWMGKELNKIGLSVSRITSISDQENEIIDSIQEALKRSQIVLITGGLGPTRDDITKAALCKFFNTKLVFNEQVLSDVENRLKGRVKNINELNRNQAMVPENCTVIRNSVGTAPIMWFQHPEGIVVSMPGVPTEMKYIMEHQILPRLANIFKIGIVKHKTIHVFNIPEAVLAETISEWEDAVPSFIKVAYLPAPGKIRLRLSARGDDATKIDEAIEIQIKKLQAIIGDNIFGYDNQAPEQEVLKALKNKNQTLALAESCSGGYMSHLITSVAGASEVFKGGVVAYSNETKVNLLGVDNASIQKYGAVSRQVVEQMAQGVCKVLNTTYGVACSGIAGPTGGSAEKPVGTVWLAWAGNGKVISRKFNFGNNRERCIIQTAEAGIILLKQFIERNDI